MSAQKIRTALGLLQDDPDQESAWTELEEAVTAPDPGLPPVELSRLLRQARQAHELRREWDAVVKLLELEISVGAGGPDEGALQADLARVYEDEVLDDKATTAAYTRLLELRPGDPTATEALERNAAKRDRWKDLVDRYMTEVEATTEPVFKSSLLLNAAETAFRYGGKKKGAVKEITARLEEALKVDPKNRRAALLLERLYRTTEKWEDVARVLEILGQEGAQKDERLAAFVRLGRVFSQKAKSTDRALGAYERVLDMSPGHPEAMSFLASQFSEREDWDHLVALYEDQLKSGGVRAGQETGILVQIAMVHWRMRNKPDVAEAWFERVRKMEPAHTGMLAFFREHYEAKGLRAKLVNVLSDAQRAIGDGPERSALSSEIARLAEDDANAGKAIEQYKSILRTDPANREARDALRRLYTQTEAWNALVELMRQELERTAPDDKAGRLAALHEIARIYRQHIKSDTALVTVLTQIVQIDEKDAEAIRDLVRVYEALQRWRDLLTYQQKLADLSEDRIERITLYRATAQRWLDQFSNVANAVESYESLLGVAPDDEEARVKLRELYGKRRAWPQLYALSEQELANATGTQRVELLVEMAKLAAERLDRGADAIRLYREALALDEAAPGVLDALEKQAERDRDFATVADVLERRVAQAPDDAQRLVVLQKLGSVYADRQNDPVSAARAWRRVLELSPGHAKALRVLRDSYLASGDLASLEELYSSQSDWDGLAEVLSTAADKSQDPSLKVEYSRRVAKVYEERLNAPDRAFRAYERILAVQPNDAASARALVPIFEREERWARLPSLYEILLAQAETTEDRVDLYRKLADVAGKRLHDKAAAVTYARKAYALAPSVDGALDFLERTAEEAGAWDALSEAIKSRLEGEAETLSRGDRRALQAKLADILALHHGKVDEAVDVYRKLVEEEPGDLAIVETLDRMLRSAQRHDDLRWLFELRASTASPEGRAPLFVEWATLEEEVFGDPQRAVFLYRRVLETEPEHAASLASLTRLLLAANDAKGAAEVLTKRRDLAEGKDRTDRDLDLAELYAGPLEQPVEALEAVVQALELSPKDGRAIAMLERLLEIPATRARAAEVLQGEYERGGDPRREAESIRVLLEQTADSARKLELHAKLADVYERKLNQASTALDVVLRAVAEYPSELALWDRAADLATSASRPTDLAEALKNALMATLPEAVEVDLCERAATLFDDKLGNPEGAVPYLERVLARQPSNERAFQRLKQILTSTERWGQLEALYERVTEAADASRKVELYAEVALVCEEITQENAKAITYYERILAIDPLYEQALRSLDTLYRATARPRELSQLLEKRLQTATSEETAAYKLRLGRIHLDELHEPQLALHHLEEVLKNDPANTEARDLVERVLEVGSLRARAAEVLEEVYASRDDARNLVRVLEIRLESAKSDDVRREILHRVAELRDQRLQDDRGSLETFARLVPLDPGDGGARTRLMEIGRRLEEHQRVANVLLMAGENADTRERKAEILMDVARIYEDLLGDRERAEEIYRRVVTFGENDADLVLPAARALERIYESGQNPRSLAEMLRLEVKLETDVEKRREIWGRLGELSETTLDDIEGAIQAWRARLDDDAADDRALAALERLYERASLWRELVSTLRSREQVAKEPDERRRLLTKAAEILAGKLEDTSEAIFAWRAVHDEFGPDRPTLSALASLYEKAREWHDLATTLEAELALVDDTDARLSLYARLGDVRREHLDDLPGALEAYRQALTQNPSHAPSRQALESLLENKDARREAAEILHPLYETEGDFEKLLRVLEIEAETADGTAEKLAVLEKAVRTAEGPLQDPARAFRDATRAVREAVGEPSLKDWLERLETLTKATGRHAELVHVLSEISNDILDGDIQLSVRIRIADLARKELGDRALSRDWYKKALQLRSDDRTALTSLESLYEEMGDAPALLGVVQQRVEVAENDGERRELLYRQAKLTREVHDGKEAIAVYEAILDLGLDAPAVAALEELYAAAGRHDDLVALYERQITDGGGATAELHVKLATVAEKSLNDTPRAFEELEKALALDAQYAGAITSLERLLESASDPEHRARAGEMLEPVYLRRADWKSVMRTVHARLDASHEPALRRALLKRLSKLHEEQEEDYKAALETTAKLLHEDIADEDTWAELERLAKVAGSEARLAEIYATELEGISHDEPHTAKIARRTGEIYASLGQTDKALAMYRRALAYEPESRELFAAVDGLLVKSNRAPERVELFRAGLDHRYEPADRLAMLHVIADLEETALSQPDKAIETYRAALDVEEKDSRSLEALTRLYRAEKRWRDLAELYQRRADLEQEPEASAAHRLALARLSKNELSDVIAAIDQLEAIVQVAPWHKEAIAELEKLTHDETHKARVVEILLPLYERGDDWRDLIRLNEQRLSLANDAGEKIAIHRETAKLYEERAGDAAKAFESIRAAFAIDPEDATTRGELDRLAAQLSAWNELADSYEKAITGAETHTKRELLGSLAKVHDGKRDDPRRALDAYDRLSQLDNGDIEPLEAMDGLAMMLSDWPTVVRVLTKKAELLSSDEERASTWRRIGEAKRDMLDDAAGAIRAYEQAAELDPESVFTVDCLLDLYEAKDDTPKLVELYRRRVELAGADDADLKYELLSKMAKRYEEQLSSRHDAIETLREALATRPADKAALAWLDRLLREEQMWPDLLDNLRLQAATAETTEERVALRRAMGDLYREKLDEPSEALGSYRQVLEEAASDDASIAAVRAIGDRHEELRALAADILEPVLRASGRFRDLVAVLELRLRSQQEPAARATTLRSIALVEEINLSSAEAAEQALLRALAETPDDDELHAEIERLAEASNGYGRYADALDERSAAVFDAAVTQKLRTRLGIIAEERLKDDPRAIVAYRAALDDAGDSASLLSALDRLYSRSGDAKALAEIIERRVPLEEDAGGRADLHHRLALLQIEKFHDAHSALGTLRLALESKQDHPGAREALESLVVGDTFDEAAEILDGVYRSLADHGRLASLLEKRVGHAATPADRIRGRLDLARVLETDASDPRRAQSVLEAAFSDDPSDPDVLAEIERLAPVTEGYGTAAASLSAAIERAEELLPEAARDLYVRLAGWYRDKLGDGPAAEQAYERALTKDPESIDILRSLEDLRRAPGRERELVDTLRRRAKLETDIEQKRVLLREAKTIAESTVGDDALAEATLRQLLGENEADLWALEELTRLREKAGDHAEAVKLLLRTADLTTEGADAAKLKHRAAEMYRDKLNDVAGATKLYEDLFESDSSDVAASSALRKLFEESNKPQDLGRLLERLVDVATSPAERTVLRLELARLQADKLGGATAATDTLRAILEEEPGQAQAVVELSQLYEKGGKDDDLAELLSSQIDLARGRGDTSAELVFKVRLGEIYESRLKDIGRAIETYTGVLERDPAHKGALYAVARLYEGRGDSKEVTAALEKLLAVEEGQAAVDIALRLGTAYAQQKDDAGARRSLERALEVAPTHPEARERLRALYDRTQEWEKLAQLIAGDADAAEAPADKVRLLRQAATVHRTKRDDAGAAAALLEKASALAPEDRELLLALCDAYSSSGRGSDAVRVLERIKESYGGKRSKDLAAVHHRLAQAHLADGDKTKALAELDSSFKIDPGSVATLRDLGMLTLEMGDLDRAQKSFRALLLQKLEPPAPITKAEVFFYLGEISHRQGDKAKAIQMLDRAIENDATLARAKELLAQLKA